MFGVKGYSRIQRNHARREYTIEYPKGTASFEEGYKEARATIRIINPVDIIVYGIQFPNVDKKTDHEVWNAFNVLLFFSERPELLQQVFVHNPKSFWPFWSENVKLDRRRMVSWKGTTRTKKGYFRPSPFDYNSKAKWFYVPMESAETIPEADYFARKMIDRYNTAYDIFDRFYGSSDEPIPQRLETLRGDLINRISSGTKPGLNLENSITFGRAQEPFIDPKDFIPLYGLNFFLKREVKGLAPTKFAYDQLILMWNLIAYSVLFTGAHELGEFIAEKWF